MNYPYQPQVNRPSFYSPTASLTQPMRIRPVSSLDEVRASGIDFDGSIFYFPDFAHQAIYTKQINVDGSATINMYSLTEIPSPAPAPKVEDFITRNEFSEAIASLKASLTPAAAPTQPTKVEAPVAKPEVKLNF